MGGISEAVVGVGVTPFGDRVTVDWVAEAHQVVAGATRSGKSQLLYSQLGQLARMPEVRVCGLDPSQVLLSPFMRRGVREPWIAVGSDPAGYVRVVQALIAELDRRLVVLDEAGADKFAVFSPAFPLVVVVLEEFAGVLEIVDDADAALSRADRRGPVIRSAVRRLVREGAKAGFRVVVALQRADAEILGGNVRANISTRISFRIDDVAGVRMLFENASPDDVARVESFYPGQGYFRSSRQRFTEFQSFYVGDYAAYRRHVESLDPRVLATLSVDRHQREVLASEFPWLGDPG